jgi:glutamine amidotransferase
VKIGILDYKNCSILSIISVFLVHNIEIEIITNPKQIQKFDKIVLPGVSATNKIMTFLRENNFVSEIKEFADKNKSILGICAGMQILGKNLHENELTSGLGFFDTDVLKINKEICDQSTNIGWNEVISDNDYKNYYFCHSFYMKFSNENDKSIFGYINLKKKIPAFIKKNNIIGLQYHPEKSQSNGRKIISKFINNEI